MQDFKYDVAFSFLAKDEPTATQINDQLAGRVETFLYSRRQEEVAGTDGYNTFADVFEQDSRIVVVILGDGWGERGFTLAEKTAIQNRAMQQGWDFLQVLVVDRSVGVPKFIPKTHIYFDWERWGIDGACSVIEAHVKRAGGELREPTFLNIATRKQHELELEQARQQFRMYKMDGVNWFREESEKLIEEIGALAKSGPIGMAVQPQRGMITVRAAGVAMSVVAEQQYSNVARGCQIRCTWYETSIQRFGRSPEIGSALVFEPDLERIGWPSWNGADRWFSTSQLADYIMAHTVRHVKS